MRSGSAADAPTYLHNPDRSATIVTMTVEPLRDVRNHFSDVVDRVEHEHERVTVTRNGRPVAVIISPEDLEGLEETLAVLSDPEALGRVS
jgi:antitoxin YefM